VKHATATTDLSRYLLSVISSDWNHISQWAATNLRHKNTLGESVLLEQVSAAFELLHYLMPPDSRLRFSKLEIESADVCIRARASVCQST
jgi:hypothetical protein